MGKYWFSKTQVFIKSVATSSSLGGDREQKLFLKKIFLTQKPLLLYLIICVCVSILFRTEILEFLLSKVPSERMNLSEFSKLSRKSKIHLFSSLFLIPYLSNPYLYKCVCFQPLCKSLPSPNYCIFVQTRICVPIVMTTVRTWTSKL